jgi:hypothetical protein
MSEKQYDGKKQEWTIQRQSTLAQYTEGRRKTGIHQTINHNDR